MRFLRTNTAVIVTVGPFYDKTDGVTIETALTITNERITLTADTDDGSAPTNILDNVTGATSGTANDLNYITGNDAGMMQLELSAANVNRLGRMLLSITDAANHVPVFHEFMVLPAMIYDAFVSGTDVLDSSVTQILGTAVSTPATAGILDVNVKNIDNDAASASGTVTFPNATLASTTNITAAAGCAVSSIGANVITATAINADAITAAKIADGAIDAATFAAGAINAAAIAADAITDAKVASDVTIASVTGAVGSVTGNVGGNVVGTVASVVGAVGSVAAGGITAASLAADAITAAKVAADVSAEIADAVWDEDATAHQTLGTFGQAIGDPVADTNTIYKAVVTDATGATVGVDVVALKAETVLILEDTGTTLQAEVDGIQADTEDIQSRLPAALSAGGNVKADVLSLGGVVQSLTDLKDFADDGYDPVTNKVQGVVLTDTVTTYTGDTPQTGDSFARLGAPAGASVSADIAAIEAQTDDIGVAGAGLTALGDARLANLDATVSSRASQSSLNTVDDLLDTELPALTAAVQGLMLASGTIGATGNDTTHLHLSGLAYADDAINSMLLTIKDVSTGLFYSRWVEDFVSAGDLATVGTLPFTPEASVDQYWILPVRADVTGGSGLDAAGVRAAIGLAAANLDTQLSTIDDLLDTEVAAIKSVVDDILIDTADMQPKLGTPAGASISADIAAIEAQTDDIGVAGAGLTALGDARVANLDAAVSSRASQTSVDDVPTNAELATALGTADDAVLAAIAALSIPTANANADALLDRAAAIEAGLTFRQAMRLIVAAEAGKLSGAAGTTITIRDVADTKDRMVATVDASGNRTAITRDVT